MKYLTISYFILLFLYILEMIDNHRLKKLINEQQENLKALVELYKIVEDN